MKGWLAAAAAAAVLLGAQGACAEWIGTWAASPVPPAPGFGPPGGPTAFADQTIKQTVRISAGGRRVRVRFTNAYGTKALAIGGASVSLGDRPPIPLTFAGQRSAIVPPGAPMLSDPVNLAVRPLAKLGIRLYLPEDTGPCTCHNPAVDVGQIGSGDQTAGAFKATSDSRLRAFLAGVEVDAAPSAKTIVTFGDSITDGVGASPDHRWPDLLADRLAARGGAWGVDNEGISGNRILEDGAGQSALARFDRDVLATPGARYVVLFEGVNDLGISYGHFEGRMAQMFQSMIPAHKATAESLMAADRQIIARAHEHGLKVIGATITPYEGAVYWTPEGEAVREAVNDWIRHGGAFDGVIDFDKAVRDPAHPTRIRDGFHAGDHLHGSDAGYKAMADSINLSLFR
jgi:lysophospholipase L1-like esterase